MCWGIHPSLSFHHSSWVPGKLSVKSDFLKLTLVQEHLFRLPRLLHKPGLEFMGKQANCQFCVKLHSWRRSVSIRAQKPVPKQAQNQPLWFGQRPPPMSDPNCPREIIDKTMGYWGCSWLEDPANNNPWIIPGLNLEATLISDADGRV